MKQPWYKSTHMIIMMLILVFPIGLLFMWRFANWSRLLKLLVTVTFLAALSYAAVLYFERETTQTQTATVSEKTQGPSPADQLPTEKQSVLQPLGGSDATVKHFAYAVVDPLTGKAVETNEKMMKYTVQSEQKEKCSEKSCTVYVWDSQASYDVAKAKLGTEAQANALANKDHLIAVLTADGVFFYKGERAK